MDRADRIIADVLENHLPRVEEGLRKGYPDENQVLVIYDHLVRARILREQTESTTKAPPNLFPCFCVLKSGVESAGHLRIKSNGIGDYFVECQLCLSRSSDVRCESEEYAIERWNRYRGLEPKDEE